MTRTAADPPIEALAVKAAEASRLLRTLANEHRLLILCQLSGRPEMSVGALTAEVGLSQSALSQHLARLRAEGLVAFRRDSQTLHYRIADPDVLRVLGALSDIYCPQLAGPSRNQGDPS
jgi:ArsR family transcriptional regulator, virulence genes transcriptional regulator